MRLIGLCVRHVIMPISVRSRGGATCPVGKNVKMLITFRVFAARRLTRVAQPGGDFFINPRGHHFHGLHFWVSPGGARATEPK